jgi:hypothetical protein
MNVIVGLLSNMRTPKRMSAIKFVINYSLPDFANPQHHKVVLCVSLRSSAPLR